MYGKPIADEILNRLKSDISAWKEKPGLAVILVGDNEASKLYVSLKEKTAKNIGMDFFRFDFPESISEAEIVEHIKKLNGDNKVHGIIVQLPLPESFNAKKIIASIDPKKDADGFSSQAGSNLDEYDKKRIWPVFPHAILRLIESSNEDIEGKKAIIIANSDEFGKAMQEVLTVKNVLADYVISNDISDNLGKIKTADIIISAVGSRGLFTDEMVKNGVIIIDGGIERVDGKIIGDVDFASMEGKNGFITPVPGGVGPLTIAYLMENVYLEFKAQQKEK